MGHGQGMAVLGSPDSVCSEIPALAGNVRCSSRCVQSQSSRAFQIKTDCQVMLGLENANLGGCTPTHGCWGMCTLPVSKGVSAVPKLGETECYTQMGLGCGLGVNSTSGRAKQYCL